ncbi:DeoR/GlpR transcriptional regulator [Raoultella terrigena]|nr:DeoR/GlpR transcriptional regulator [Raoultella terrigena]
MLTRQREQLVPEQLLLDGEVLSRELSAGFDVSEETIRRDLHELAAEGRLQRIHGGALPPFLAIATLPGHKS